MKITFLALLVLTFCACGKQTDQGHSIDADSCAFAIKFPNAKMTEKMVEADFSGDLNNYMDEEKKMLDIKHTFENGELLRSKFYYQNGVVQEEFNFRCQSIHGAVKYFHKNARLARTIPYRFGRREGEGYSYDSLGSIQEKAVFRGDSLISNAKVNQESAN